MNEDDWKVISEFEDYKINKIGVVKKTSTGKIIKEYPDKNGYNMIHISKNGKFYNRYTHRLVASTFHPLSEFIGAVVNHIDFNIKNNHYTNLEWVSRKRNSEHAVENNLYPKGETHHLSKLKNSDLIEIESLYQQGVNQYEIAKRFNVGQDHISRLINKKRRTRG